MLWPSYMLSQPVTTLAILSFTGVVFVGIYDDVGLVAAQKRNFMKSLPCQRWWCLFLFKHAIWSFLSMAPMYLQQEVNLEYLRENIHAKLCEKTGCLPCVVNYKLWHSQLCNPVPLSPVQRGGGMANRGIIHGPLL